MKTNTAISDSFRRCGKTSMMEFAFDRSLINKQLDRILGHIGEPRRQRIEFIYGNYILI